MRCYSISGEMSFDDLEAAERRRRSRAKRRPQEEEVPSAPPVPPVQPRSRLMEREETPFEPAPAPEPIIPPSEEASGRRRRRAWEPSEVIPTEVVSPKELPLPEELPEPQSEEELPDLDFPEEELYDRSKEKAKRKEEEEPELEPEIEFPKEALHKEAEGPAKERHGPPAYARPSLPIKVSPPEEQTSGRPRLPLSCLGQEGPGSPVGLLLAFLGVAAIGTAIYFIKKGLA